MYKGNIAGYAPHIRRAQIMEAVYSLGQGGVTRKAIARELDMVVSNHLSKLINSLIDEGLVVRYVDHAHYPPRYMYHPTEKLDKKMVALGCFKYAPVENTFYRVANDFKWELWQDNENDDKWLLWRYRIGAGRDGWIKHGVYDKFVDAVAAADEYQAIPF